MAGDVSANVQKMAGCCLRVQLYSYGRMADQLPSLNGLTVVWQEIRSVLEGMFVYGSVLCGLVVNTVLELVVLC